MAMTPEQANYCSQLKIGKIEAALLRCDVISTSYLWGEVSPEQRKIIKAKAEKLDIFADEMVDKMAFNAAKVVNTKLLEMMGCGL